MFTSNLKINLYDWRDKQHQEEEDYREDRDYDGWTMSQ